MRSIRLVLGLWALLWVTPATAAVEDCLSSPFSCFVVDFERYAQGTGFLDLDTDYGANTERLVGGQVEVPGLTISGDFTPRSGEKVYFGSAIDFYLSDPDCCSWGGVGAYVTGEDVVIATAYAFNYGTRALEAIGTKQTDGRNVAGSGLPPHFNLEFGDWGLGCESDLSCSAQIVKVEFRSALPFAIDDFHYGGPIGIPEPGTWALFLVGFALTGAAARRRVLA